MTVAPLRIVVVGRDGQVSRALQSVLREANHEVVVLGRPDFDLRQPTALADAIASSGAQVVINPAAYTAVDRAEDDEAAAHAINAAGAGVVASAAAKAGAPIIQFSTDYVFDGEKGRPYVESDATSPLGVYGRTKLEGEFRVTAANPRHVILRTAWVASPYGNNFVKTMLRLAGERHELSVVDDQTGNPTFAADIARAVAVLAPKLPLRPARDEAFGIFNLVNSGATTWCGFARAIMAGASARGHKAVPIRAITTADYPTRANRPASSLLSTERIARVHGIIMRPWQQALDDTLDELIGVAAQS